MREQQNREKFAKKQYEEKIIQERRAGKNKFLIYATTIVAFAIMTLSGIMMWQRQGIADGLTPPVEPTTLYIRQNDNAGIASGENIIDDEKLSKIVHVTHAGEKYHNPACRYVKYNNSVTELTLVEAAGKGYEPCKVCKP